MIWKSLSSWFRACCPPAINHLMVYWPYSSQSTCLWPFIRGGLNTDLFLYCTTGEKNPGPFFLACHTTPDVDPMLGWCWTRVESGGPTLNRQRWTLSGCGVEQTAGFAVSRLGWWINLRRLSPFTQWHYKSCKLSTKLYYYYLYHGKPSRSATAFQHSMDSPLDPPLN